MFRYSRKFSQISDGSRRCNVLPQEVFERGRAKKSSRPARFSNMRPKPETASNREQHGQKCSEVAFLLVRQDCDFEIGDIILNFSEFLPSLVEFVNSGDILLNFAVHPLGLARQESGCTVGYIAGCPCGSAAGFSCTVDYTAGRIVGRAVRRLAGGRVVFEESVFLLFLFQHSA